MPVVRIQVHTEQPVEKQKMQELAAQVQQIIDKNRAQIQHWCNARRQEHSLNTSRTERKIYKLNQLELTHTIVFNQEIVQLDVYPIIEAGEEDQLCLMIVKANKIWAIPMAQIKKIKTISKLTPIYKKTLENTNLQNDPVTGLQSTGFYRQYKFTSARVGMIVGDVKFLSDRMRVVPYPANPTQGCFFLTPVTATFQKSHQLDDLPGTIQSGAINGDAQVIQLPQSEYTYVGDSVTKTAVRSFVPTYARPYAITSTGICYFGAVAQSYIWCGVNVRVGQTLSGLTDAMSATYDTQYFKYGTWTPSAKNSPQASLTYGTIPSDNLTYTFAYDFYSYTVPSPYTDFSRNWFFPKFSTGNGDTIELHEYPFTGNVQLHLYQFLDPTGGSMLDAHDSTIAISFNDISYTYTDVGRNLTNFDFRPSFFMDIYSELPTTNGLLYKTTQKSEQHTNYLGNVVDINFFESTLYFPQDASTQTSTTNAPLGYSIIRTGHVSNGQQYIQKLLTLPGNNLKVFSDDTDVTDLFADLDLPDWDLMVMDVLLSRIKKFT